jgi:hypothetical protein
LSTRAGAADAFAVAAAFAATPATRFSFGLIVENPAATLVAADLDSRGLTARNRLYKRARGFGKNPFPASCGWNKLQLQPILALEELPFSA